MRDKTNPRLCSEPPRLRLLSITLAAALALVTFATLTPYVGLFHDDGIYVSVAASVASGEGYSLANIPGSPPQTKYPPIYTAMLALVWWVHPDFPRNALALKSVNVIFMFIALLGVARLAYRAAPSGSCLVPVACLLILGTSPALVSFADFTMSDVLFTAVAVWVFALFEAHKPTVRSESLIAILAAVAILTRSVGVAITGAIAVECMSRKQPRRAGIHLLVGIVTSACWFWWAGGSRELPSPLIAYYVEYESSALSYIFSNPGQTWSILSGNIQLAWETLALTVSPSWPLFWPVLIPLALTGAFRLARTDVRIAVLFAACYLVVVLFHPFSPHRYVLPLLPILIVMVSEGAIWAWTTVRFRRPSDSPRRTALPALAACGMLFLGNVVWLSHRLSESQNVRAWYGFDLGYRWDGFEETFEWLRNNTLPDAKIGSIFDPMYYLHTGRQSIRPWLHRPETYFYPYGEARAYVGEADEVLQMLAGLDVTYLVFDPAIGYAEGDAAITMLRDLIDLPAANASLVFKSSDGLHEVYRIDPTPHRTLDIGASDGSN
jgi:hypothetical protein